MQSRSEQYLTVFRNGLPLSSQRDPEKEAKRWVDGLPVTTPHPEIAVLGLGSAYHIRELNKKWPITKINIFELDERVIEAAKELRPQDRVVLVDLKNVTQKQKIAHELASKKIPLLSFLPSWQGLTKEFETLRDYLLGRTKESFEWLCQEFGLTESSEINQNISTEVVRNVKSLALAASQMDSVEAQKWQVMKELIS